jgi:hypothetical protein
MTLAGPASADAADVPFAQAVFAATHNSYSGNFVHERRGITQQLDAGVRFLEFDVHDEYAAKHEYTLGHSVPGDQVETGFGNPATIVLTDWLKLVNTWSSAHRGHAPITVTLDMKDDLTDDNHSFAEGNLAALNKRLTDVFGTKLVLAGDNDYDLVSLPDVSQLRNKILVVLSGDAHTRALYRRDAGQDPAVALNGNRKVVEVHKSQNNNDLWYWSGTQGTNGKVTWARHGRYGTGQTPAVAVSDDGTVVEVHKSQNNNGLYYQVGTLRADGEITWGPSRQYDTGQAPAVAVNNFGKAVEVHQVSGTGNTLSYHVGNPVNDEVIWDPGHQYDQGRTPSVAFTSLNDTKVKEIHRSTDNTRNYTWDGELRTDIDAVTWTNLRTTAERPLKDTATRGSHWVSVWTASDGTTPPETLQYNADGFAGGRIRYQQVAFAEFQSIDEDGHGTTVAELRDGTLFWAAPATETFFIEDARDTQKVVRGWDFDHVSVGVNIANFPATNEPYSQWYKGILSQYHAITF